MTTFEITIDGVPQGTLVAETMGEAARSAMLVLNVQAADLVEVGSSSGGRIFWNCFLDQALDLIYDYSSRRQVV